MAGPANHEGPLGLGGRVAVVTGGSKGIGRGVAEALRAAGAAVVIWARDLDNAREAAAPMGACAVRCDVRDRSSVEAALAETVGEVGDVDVLVGAAGRSSALMPFLDMAEEAWHDVLDTNLGGALRTTQVVGRHMAERGRGGKVVLVSSLRTIMGAPTAADYAASKGGLESMVRCAAMALAPYDIQVNAVRPGWVRTEMTRKLWDVPGAGDRPPAPIPAARWGEPADLGGVVTYLASAASGYHTGDVITVDGGLTAASGGGSTGAGHGE